jgi:glycosyltransferase involved in cell wall biosynthesis
LALVRPTCVLAANAVPRRGGQGWVLHHAMLGLGDAFDLTVFARDGGPDGGPVTGIATSRLSRALHAVPVLRRRRDWIVLADDVGFDHRVARRLPRAPLFHGATHQCLASLRRARALGARTVVDVMTQHVDVLAAEMERECRRFGIRSPLHPLLVARARAEYRDADLIRVMTERARSTFLERGFDAGRVFAAPPPVALDEFPPAAFTHDRFRVSCVGLLEPWKGFHYLIEAFAQLTVRDAELVLWGGPGSRPVSRYLAERMSKDPRIRFEPVDVRAVGYAKVYGSSNVLVHPSLSDGYAYAVAEAMASGIPVVVTDRTGAADLVEDGISGYIVPARDPGAILERLRLLADRPALVREMGAAARRAMAAQTLERFRATYVPPLRALLG